MSISRGELAELFAEDDRQRASHAEWMADREAAREALAQKSDHPARLLFRTTDNALLPALPPERKGFDEAASIAPNFFDDAERNEEFADTMGYLINELREEWKRDIARMERRINKAISEAKNSDDDHVVDLPNWRRRDAA